MKIYDVLILGAGASGLMCAAHLERSLDVALVDCNEKVAKKLKISGGGKCNITNVEVDVSHYDSSEDALQNALDLFSKEDLLSFLASNGIEPEIRKGRYYFCKNSSDEIINILKEKTKNTHLLLNHEILQVKKEQERFDVYTQKGLLHAKKVVVATGGKSYKTLGASDIGLEIAKSFALDVVDFTPALVGLTVQKEQFWMKELSGLSCYVEIRVAGKNIYEEMLFAHKGISGPAVLSASLYWQKGNIEIDFLPKQNILKLLEGSKKLLSSIVPLPKRLAKALLEALDVEDVVCNKINKEQKEKLSKIHHYEFAPAGNFGFSKAEVSRGGVALHQLNAYTLEALDVDGLFFIGEVVDITGELGGYNFQWAFSSGVVCAKSINTNS
ncbi:MAG: aminoacetone oxidase family FAD-binding enzyme [Sulfurimonas sp.]|jgi:predicted Rossmann fold flavoprotein|nr:aminoacetone oxidase family FAD-binding enzyme [Sulfurimonas sp.]